MKIEQLKRLDSLHLISRKNILKKRLVFHHQVLAMLFMKKISHILLLLLQKNDFHLVRVFVFPIEMVIKPFKTLQWGNVKIKKNPYGSDFLNL